MSPSEGRYGYIYLVTNQVNGKSYVGKTVLKIIDRWNTHKSHAFKKMYPMVLHVAIRKHGGDAFVVEQVCRAKEELLPALERFFIKYFGTRVEGRRGYNMTAGGDGCSGCRPSHATRQKMSKALIGNKRALGRVLSEESLQRLRDSNRCKKKSPEYVESMKKRMAGRKLPPGHVENMSRSRMKDSCKNGHPRTPENTYTRIRKDRGNGRLARVCRLCRRKPLVATPNHP